MKIKIEYFNREQVIGLIDELLQRPDLLLDAVQNEQTDHTAESLLEDAEDFLGIKEPHSQFKVEPGLSLQQCKDEVAMKNGFNSWIAMNEARYIKDHRDDYEIHLNEVLNEAVELYAASLTSEIKGLREKIVALEKDIDLAYKSGYHEGKEDARDIDYPVIQS